MRIVFVCAGNICRSPLAEHALRRDLDALGVPAPPILSAGLVAIAGQSPVPGTLAIARSRGLDLAAHRATTLAAGLLAPRDIVLVMERSQREAVTRMRAGADVHLLGAFAPGHPEEIADPEEDGPEEAFRACADHVESAVAGLVRWLQRRGDLPTAR